MADEIKNKKPSQKSSKTSESESKLKKFDRVKHGSEFMKPYHWAPGKSGNPSGRSMMLPNYIKEMTGGGREMVDVMIRIMRGEKIPGAWGIPTYGDLRSAAMWLTEQAYGRTPVVLHEDGTSDGVDIVRMIYLELQKKNGTTSTSIVDVKPQAL